MRTPGFAILLATVAFLATAGEGRGVERRIGIEAPASVAAGATCPVVLAAATDAGQGEHIGLLQTDYSTDGGRTWTGLCYLGDLGPETRQERTITAGPAGSMIKVRLRVAFRGGLAGDVDYLGAAIRWNATWNDWKEPPAKSVVIAVK